MNKRFAPVSLLLVGAAIAHADNAWERHIEASGTPFEARWAIAEPLYDQSSAETMLGAAGIRAENGELELYVVHPSPILAELAPVFGGEEIECQYGNWRLAIDSKEFEVAGTAESTDNSATFIKPHEEEAFWDAFVDSLILAVQVEKTCSGNMDVATMVFSLVGSKEATYYVSKRSPPISREEKADLEIIETASMEGYISAMQMAISRGFAPPPSTPDDLECVVDVWQLPGGTVTDIEIGRCNGNEAVRRAIEAAVFKASPLPVPEDSSLFEPNIRITFRPETHEDRIAGIGDNSAEPDTPEDEMLPIVRVEPVYPARALSRGVEGYVDMSFTVTTTGTVKDPVVAYSTNSLFDRAATRAVLKFKYKPRVIDGVAVDVPNVTERITFRIEE